MTITVTLTKAPELTPEERQQRYRRAAEALDGCGWVFDEHISSLTQQMLDTQIEQTNERDALFLSIRAATELKAKLIQILNEKALEDERNARRERAGS